ncbi:hypothetical protein GGX14DRAFT_388881 [Mycena pura]|uniref:HNH nuclease domain-containing protein n=1 Tax=Mycena pura TaxID=153505 RepID=A0AAD6VT30_9AGAR|nr:hypothetical protein GGX14DRAFT_388881 [Mycena pura]
MWEFRGEPIPDLDDYAFFWNMPDPSGALSILRQPYAPILRREAKISRAADNVLTRLWDAEADDQVIKNGILDLLGIPFNSRVQANARYDTIKNDLFGCGPMPRENSIAPSLILRILQAEIDVTNAGKKADILVKDNEVLSNRHSIRSSMAPKPPVFYFYVRLKVPDGFELKPRFKKYAQFTSWIRVRDQEAFTSAVAAGHWQTLADFREVLMALLGQHLLQTATFQIFCDEALTIPADDNGRLNGPYFIELPCTATTNCVRFGDLSRAPKEDARSSAFAKAVNRFWGEKCAATSNSDCNEAAHILPSNAVGVDTEANGLLLWIAIHRPWDHHKLAVLCRRNEYLVLWGRNTWPAYNLQNRKLRDVQQDSEFRVLMQLRLTLTLIAWFADVNFVNLLAMLCISPELRLSQLLRPINPGSTSDDPQPPDDDGDGYPPAWNSYSPGFDSNPGPPGPDSTQNQNQDADMADADNSGQMMESEGSKEGIEGAGDDEDAKEGAAIEDMGETRGEIDGGRDSSREEGTNVTGTNATLTPSTSNSSNSSGGGTTSNSSGRGTTVSKSTEATDVSIFSVTKDPIAEVDEDEEKEDVWVDNEGEGTSIEISNEELGFGAWLEAPDPDPDFIHWPNCVCEIEDPKKDGPCIHLLLGAIQFWGNLLVQA